MRSCRAHVKLMKCESMRILYGGVPMPDAGYGGPDPVDRRYDNPDSSLAMAI